VFILSRKLFIEPEVKPVDLSASFDSVNVQFTVRINSAKKNTLNYHADSEEMSIKQMYPDSAIVVHAQDSIYVKIRRIQHVEMRINGEEQTLPPTGQWELWLNREGIYKQYRIFIKVSTPESDTTSLDVPISQPAYTGHFTADSLMALVPIWDTRRASFRPDSDILLKIEDLRPNITLVCFFGTWDTVSGDVIPRLIRILNKAYLPDVNLSLIGVDREMKDRGGMAAMNRVQGLPTLLFLEGGQEIGRIVGRPRSRLEDQIFDLLLKSKNRQER